MLELWCYHIPSFCSLLWKKHAKGARTRDSLFYFYQTWWVICSSKCMQNLKSPMHFALILQKTKSILHTDKAYFLCFIRANRAGVVSEVMCQRLSHWEFGIYLPWFSCSGSLALLKPGWRHSTAVRQGSVRCSSAFCPCSDQKEWSAGVAE